MTYFQAIDCQLENYQQSAERMSLFVERSGKTQSEIARITGLNAATISRISKAKQVMGKDVIFKLTQHFDVNGLWLETGEGEMGSARQKAPINFKDRKSLRLIELRQALNLEPEVMAERLGMSLQEYYDAEAGKTPFSNQFTALISYAFNISRLWWEYGEGEMLEPTGEKELELVDIEEFETVFLPLAPVNVEGTFGEMSDPESNYGSFKKVKVVVPKGTNVERNIIFKLRGNSMAPVYPEGTLVRCKKVRRGDWEYLSPGVYAVSYGNSFVFKRIKDNELLSKGYLTLHSDNPMAPGSIVVPLDQIRHIWQKLSINYSEPD